MDIFFQQLINGLTIGSLYALVALGYTMVYGVMKLINFAHGDLVAFSAYVGLTIFTQFYGSNALSLVNIVIVFCLTAIVVAFVGVLLERLAYRPLRTAPRLSAVVSALGASLVIQNGIMLIWGPNMEIFPSDVFPTTSWDFGGVIISFTQIIILALSAVVMVSLYIFINKTKMGNHIVN